MILQERLYFRNIPLSNWVEHEMIVEDNAPGSGATCKRAVGLRFPKSQSVDDDAVIRMPQHGPPWVI